MFYPAGEVKIKLFKTSSPEGLEEKVNDFIASIPDFIFVSFRAKVFTTTSSQYPQVGYLGELVYSNAIAAPVSGEEAWEGPGGFMRQVPPQPFAPTADEEESEEDNA